MGQLLLPSTQTIAVFSAAPGDGRWLQMDQELETRNGQTVGTSKPTGHNVLVDARFELPFGEFTTIVFTDQYSKEAERQWTTDCCASTHLFVGTVSLSFNVDFFPYLLLHSGFPSCRWKSYSEVIQTSSKFPRFYYFAENFLHLTVESRWFLLWRGKQ